MIENHNWPGNIRQLKNFAEKLSIVEEKRLLNSADLKSYLRPNSPQTSLVKSSKTDNTQYSDREILYKILFDLKNDLNDLKKITLDLIEDKNSNIDFQNDNAERIERIYNKNRHLNLSEFENIKKEKTIEPEFIEENLSLQDNEYEMIQKALEKNNGKRKFAAQELGISERTLYRKQNNMIYKKLIISLIILNYISCGVYSFNGASINEDVKTIKVNYISNKSSLAQPQLSSLLTELLIDKFQSETNLLITDYDAHVIFSGSIVKYDIKPVSIQNNEIAAQNRLTISVEIEHINNIDEKLGLKKYLMTILILTVVKIYQKLRKI